MSARVQVDRLRLGTFVRPGSETADGHARAEVVLGYLVRHPQGRILLDTGMGSHPDVDAHYRPRRTDVREALRRHGLTTGDVTLVVNCHLHFDHCGGNPLFPGTPVVTQRRELALARGVDHTLPELVDFAGARYEELDGAAELLPGVYVLATPGHTAGHQSLAVRTDDGTVVLAGQAHDRASDFTAAVLARELRLRGGGAGEHGLDGAAGADGADGADGASAHAAEGADGAVPEPPSWLDDVLALDPRRVLFAHDQAVWEPG